MAASACSARASWRNWNCILYKYEKRRNDIYPSNNNDSVKSDDSLDIQFTHPLQRSYVNTFIRNTFIRNTLIRWYVNTFIRNLITVCGGPCVWYSTRSTTPAFGPSSVSRRGNVTLYAWKHLFVIRPVWPNDRLFYLTDDTFAKICPSHQIYMPNRGGVNASKSSARHFVPHILFVC